MKTLGLECRNVGSWMQSCVAIAFIKTKPVWQENMLDLIPGCDIVIKIQFYKNFSQDRRKTCNSDGLSTEYNHIYIPQGGQTREHCFLKIFYL